MTSRLKPALTESLVVGGPQAWDPIDIATLLDTLADWGPDRVFLIHAGSRVTYGSLRREVHRVAGILQQLELAEAPLAILMDNTVEWVTTFFAAAVCGIPSVPVNPRFVARETLHVLGHSRAGALATAARFARCELADYLESLDLHDPGRDGSWSQALPHLKHVLCLGEPSGLPGVLDVGKPFEQPADLAPDTTATSAMAGRIALVQYTSGTTGFPKGVLLTQDQMLRNAWSVGARLGMRPDDLLYSPAPFHHVGGVSLSLLMALVHGAALAFPVRFDPDEMLAAIDDLGCTVIAAVETMTIRLLEADRMKQFDGGTLRAGWCAGVPEFWDRFPGMVNIFGQSECSPNAAMAYHDAPIYVRRGSCGGPQPDVEIGIANAESASNAWLPVGERGEIRVRGWNVMNGYLYDLETTAQTVSPDGWLRTGDLGWLDDAGHLHFVGRLKDTLRVGGELVSPDEVEAVLMSHPLVRTAAVIGIPDRDRGEVACGCIELVSGASASSEVVDQLLGHAAMELARFKVPQRFEFFLSLPLTESGKVQRFRIRQEVMRRLTQTERSA